MTPEKLGCLESGIADRLKEQLGTLQEHAEHFAHRQVEKMIEEEQAIQLTEDEERLLKSYRAFVSRSIPGAVFSWKSPEEAKLVIPETRALLRDPREMSTAEAT